MGSPSSPRSKSSAQSAAKPFMQYAVLAGWVVGIGGIIVAAAVLVPRMVTRTAQAQPSAPIQVVLAGEPRWLPAEDRQALTVAILKGLSGGPLDREGLQAAQQAAERSGWFERVTQVRRTDIDKLVVEGDWATPFALVSDATGEHLVDTHSRLLPRSYAVGSGPNMLRIQGVTQPRPAQIGEPWQGTDLTAALQMAALMNDKTWRTQIAAIDLSGFGKDSNIRLRTDTGCELIWGRAPGQENAMEVPALQKLAALQYFFDHHGRIDAGGAQCLDLRADVVGAR